MPISKPGLGRGLGSLIPDNFDVASVVENGERIERLKVTDLTPNPHQPRTQFDEEALKELAGSIKRYGIVQPLVVSPHKGGYSIVAGERRWRAAQLAGLKDVPAIVRTAKELERLEIALIENVQRVDLGALEQAFSIERLHQQFNVTYNEIAERLGKATSTINNLVRLLQLPDEAKKALMENTISEGHARQVLALKDTPKQQLELLGLIVKHGWSVRQAENYVNSIKDGFSDTKAATTRMASETPLTKQLSDRYGTNVKIRRTAKGGRVEIAFGTDEQLAELLNQLAR